MGADVIAAIRSAARPPGQMALQAQRASEIKIGRLVNHVAD
jgi:hypothetical protein